MEISFGDMYRGKRVLLTGHTGFKGAWLAIWLHSLGAKVTGYALAPPTDPSLFEIAGCSSSLNHVEADIRNASLLQQVVNDVRPQVLFHLAAQPLVRLSYEQPMETLSTNIIGTANLLESVRMRSNGGDPCAVVIVTSDKCYENREWVYGYREEDPLGGHDPYSMSKGSAELVVSSWRRSFFPGNRIAVHGVRLASVRAGNVIGGGDWGKDRIVVDCIAALRSGKPIGVRNPHAIRPWQHVLEPLSAYLQLGSILLDEDPSKAGRYAEAWNFGPSVDGLWTVGRLVEEVVRRWGQGSWKDISHQDSVHEANFLSLNCDKAYHRMGWKPVWDVSRAVEKTVSWFKALESGTDMREVSISQIAEYRSDAMQAKSPWVRRSTGAGKR